MKIDVQSVAKIFDELLDGRMTRSAAELWATEVLREREADALEFVPRADQERIWEAVMYLYAVDAQAEPGEHMYSEEGILLAKRELCQDD